MIRIRNGLPAVAGLLLAAPLLAGQAAPPHPGETPPTQAPQPPAPAEAPEASQPPAPDQSQAPGDGKAADRSARKTGRQKAEQPPPQQGN
jgi:hypothetical protein